jgi:hypothetical protein
MSGKAGKKINEIGNIYGRLKVLYGIDTHANHALWVCVCECGNKIKSTGTHLRTGHTTSCGCSRLKHGLSGSKVYNAWNAMISRCYNINNHNFKNYGARGISVCDRWKESPINFILDMGVPDSKMSIERIDVNGNYDPDNCRWATNIEQARNRRSNNIIDFNGTKMCASSWAEKLGINRSTLENRLTVRGWSIEKCLTEPVRFKSQQIGN